MKVFVDTNIWVRYFVRDNKEQFEYCSQLIKSIESGKVRSYVSPIVLLELFYVLQSVYDVPRIEVSEDIQAILDMRMITILDRTDSRKAFDVHTNTHVKYSDCLIATQLSKDMILCTYDIDFKKFDGIRVANPKQVLGL